jgi:hypothetical protein
MKITRDQLTRSSSTVGFAILESVDDAQCSAIVDRLTESTDDSVEVFLTVGGVQVDPQKFFDLFEQQMEGFVKSEAKKLLMGRSDQANFMVLESNLEDLRQQMRDKVADFLDVPRSSWRD